MALSRKIALVTAYPVPTKTRDGHDGIGKSLSSRVTQYLLKPVTTVTAVTLSYERINDECHGNFNICTHSCMFNYTYNFHNVVCVIIIGMITCVTDVAIREHDIILF